MAQLVVRNLDEDLVQRLKIRAAGMNRSAEEEHRKILQSVLSAPKRRSLAEVLTELPDVGNDDDFVRV